jgi:hypothetical protein
MSRTHERRERVLNEFRELLATQGMSVQSEEAGEDTVLLGRLEDSGDLAGEVLRVTIHVSDQDVVPESSDSGYVPAR